MISGEPKKEILRFSESTEAIVVHLVDPKFAATSVVSVDLASDRMDKDVHHSARGVHLEHIPIRGGCVLLCPQEECLFFDSSGVGEEG